MQPKAVICQYCNGYDPGTLHALGMQLYVGKSLPIPENMAWLSGWMPAMHDGQLLHMVCVPVM